MTLWKIVTLVITLVSIGAPLVAGFTAWLSPSVKSAVFALGSPVAVAVVLAVYFNWRGRFKRRILAEEGRDDELVRAA